MMANKDYENIFSSQMAKVLILKGAVFNKIWAVFCY